ncbi:MAG: hypothetical protein A4S15_05360 [Candidatus Raskinella chloraquaticus]|uniref:Uncharacterized protein n=1 Tax=Candidatus Raskinella chloraquaticus TaxID=1951219 RepID=A0A1W9I0W2_9HYPH|nr:MAG: hypothetical protein A4S15_05360 [Proteobacteria bacterium SG_bin8]
MTKRSPVSIHFTIVALILALAGAGGCSSPGRTGRAIVDSGITPTSDVRSAETVRPGGFIPVGVTPPLPVPDLSIAERQTIEQELLAARARVKTLATSPVDKPLPLPPPPQPATAVKKNPNLPADFQNQVY